MNRFFFVFIFVTEFMSCGIIIRKPVLKDVSKIMNLDRLVNFEYFKPIYINGYAHLSVGQNPDYYIEQDLKYDEERLCEAIKIDSFGDFIAVDQDNNKIIGYISAKILNSENFKIRLLIVDKKYRGQRIGKRLINELLVSALKCFPKLKYCIVYPYKFANEDTLKFYMSVGFENLGLPEDYLQDNLYKVKYSELYYYFRLDLSKFDIKRVFKKIDFDGICKSNI